MTNYPQENIKPYNDDEKKSVQVEKMFDNIAPAYDQLNHALSWNIDKSWRRKAINWLKPFHPQRMMDVATGTGDFAIQACRILQPEELIGTDISEGMMNVGREKVKAAGLESRISFAKEDCTAHSPSLSLLMSILTISNRAKSLIIPSMTNETLKYIRSIKSWPNNTLTFCSADGWRNTHTLTWTIRSMQHLHYGENKQGTKTLTYEQSKKEEYFNRSIRLKAS